VNLKSSGSQSRGLTYLEVMISTVLIVITLVPALDALSSGILGSRLHREQVSNQSRLTEKMEQTLATPFAELLTQADAIADPNILIPAPYSDASGTDFRRLVYIAHYDGDNADADNDVFTGTEAGLLWVKVVVEGTPLSVETLVHE
jgi:hypothetical protein